MKPRLDPTEAPSGYRARYARGAYECAGCAGAGHENVDLCEWMHSKVPCWASDRKDKCHARYVEIVKAPKRPSPSTTFARWWKKQPGDWRAAMRVFGGDSVEALARRAFNAGRRAALKKEKPS